MIDQLSKYYSCRILTEKDIPSILSLYESNPLYFQHCPPEPNFATVKEDMLCLPEGKAKADKFFVGFWNGSDLVAVMDFVYAYPDEETVFIGLFMVDQAYQRKGIGSHIVTEALAYFARTFERHVWLMLREIRNLSIFGKSRALNQLDARLSKNSIRLLSLNRA